MRAYWWEKRMVCFDVESTSPDPDVARIVTVSVAYVGGGRPTVAHTYVADPGVEIPDDAAAIHGYTTERAQREGLPIEAVLEQTCRLIQDAAEQGLAVIVFNARYDLTVLDRECRRHGVTPMLARARAHIVDPLIIDRFLDPYRKSRPSGWEEGDPTTRQLAGMSTHYGIDMGDAHDAEVDAVAAGRLAYRICRGGYVKVEPRDGEESAKVRQMQANWTGVRSDLAKLHSAQVSWAFQQAEDLERFFKSLPDYDGKMIETDWPVVLPDWSTYTVETLP